MENHPNDEKITDQDHEIWIKDALENRATGKIALLTTTNSRQNIVSSGNRAIQSQDPDWFVGQYRMCAPLIFWKELQNRLES